MTATIVGWAQRNGIFFALLALLTFLSVSSPNFRTVPNLTVVLLQVSITGIIAIPGAMLILAGYVDLSVGSLMVLASVVFGQAFQAGYSVATAIALGLGVTLLWGLMNGFLIAVLDFSPIVVTLGGLAAARGIAEALSQGQTVTGFGPDFAGLGNGVWFGRPVPVFLFFVTVAVGAYIWYQMPYGSYLKAIGSNPGAARTLGVPVRTLPFVVYAASGLAAGFGGLILTSQLDGASLSIGHGEELAVLTAILLGGVSFLGGRGSLFGVVCGLLFIAVLQNGLVLIQVGVFYQDVAVGVALFAAAALDVLYRRLERIPLGGDGDDE
jgi:ribose/xylose/arabinose/galactoside ABC-type transport system permease subunit